MNPFSTTDTEWFDMASQILLELTQHTMQLGRWDRAIELARQHIALQPFHESAQLQLIQSLYLSGKQDDARRHFEQYKAELKESHNLSPTPALEDAMFDLELGSGRARVMAANSSRIAGRIPREMTPLLGRQKELSKLRTTLLSGKHRLLTLCGEGGIGKTRLAISISMKSASFFPDGICFVRLEDFAESTDESSYAQGALSAQKGLVQRKRESLELKGQEERKSWLLRAMADALGGTYQVGTTLEEEIRAYLQKKEMLIILDNFELFVESRSLLLDILEQMNDIVFLVTSRRELQCEQEFVLRIRGLHTPKAEGYQQIQESPAVQLFIECANRRGSSLQLKPENALSLMKICQLLEGMPLGIELAAAWIHKYTQDQIAARLEEHLSIISSQMYGTPSRHRSVAAVFSYSWSLLDEQEKVLLIQCGLFTGGFTADAAKQIVGVSREALKQLCKHSLLREENHRFSFHPLLEQFVKQKHLQLEKTDESSLSRTYSTIQAYNQYYLRTVCAPQALDSFQEMHMKSQEQRAESKNVCSAWQQALDAQDVELLLETIVGFHDFIRRTGHDLVQLHELLSATARLLEAFTPLKSLPETRESTSSLVPLRLRLRVEVLLTRCLVDLERFGEVFEKHAKFASLMEASEDLWTRAHHQLNLGFLAKHQKQIHQSIAFFRKAASLSQTHQFAKLEIAARSELSTLLWHEDEFQQGLGEFTIALERCVARGDLQIADGIMRFGGSFYQTKDLELSYEYLKASLTEAKASQNLPLQICMTLLVTMQALMLNRFGDLHTALIEVTMFNQLFDSKLYHLMTYYMKGRLSYALGRYKESKAYFTEIRHYADEINHTKFRVLGRTHGGVMALALGDLEEAQVLSEHSIHLVQKIKAPNFLCNAYESAAIVYEGLGQYDKAKSAYQEAYQLAQALQFRKAVQIRSAAGIAWIDFQQGEHQKAMVQVEQALPTLLSPDTFYAVEPGWSYWKVYQILSQTQPSIAQEVLQCAKMVLDKMAANIEEPMHRKSFLEQVTWNRLLHTTSL